MSNRYYDSSKFDDTWYRKLTPVQKCLWEYLLCKCDIAGLWKVDLETASYYIGQTITGDDVKVLDGRIVILNGGGEWFIPKFVLFQQKIGSLEDLNPSNKCHLTILKMLTLKGLIAPRKPLGRGYSVSISNSNTYTPKKQHLKLFNILWNRYPRKMHMKEALKHFNASVETKQDWKDINKAMSNFLNSNIAKGEYKYIPHGSTWFNNWKDWVSYYEIPPEVSLRKKFGLEK